MTLPISAGWSMDVDRGPEWLFVRLHCPGDGKCDGVKLAQFLWLQLEQQFTRRLVLELDELPMIRSAFLGELVSLYKRIVTKGGCLRLVGLSESNQEVLKLTRLNARLPNFGDRAKAVMGRG